MVSFISCWLCVGLNTSCLWAVSSSRPCYQYDITCILVVLYIVVFFSSLSYIFFRLVKLKQRTILLWVFFCHSFYKLKRIVVSGEAMSVRLTWISLLNLLNLRNYTNKKVLFQKSSLVKNYTLLSLFSFVWNNGEMYA